MLHSTPTTSSFTEPSASTPISLSPSELESPSQSALNGMESPSPSPSQSHSELESQSRSRSQSQATSHPSHGSHESHTSHSSHASHSDSCLLSPDSSDTIPHSALRIPHSDIPPSDLPAHGRELFHTILLLVRTLFEVLVERLNADAKERGIIPKVRTACLVVECLTTFISLSYTLHKAPERITPRQLLRLAKAARALKRLTGQSFDFTPWTSLTPSELDTISPKPKPNPLSPYRQSPRQWRIPSGSIRSSFVILHHPGATLANVIKKMVRILPPDYTPETFIPELSPSPSQSALNGMESPSPSPSQSELELESQSQSRSQSQSIPSTVSIPYLHTLATHDGTNPTSHAPP